MGKRTVLNVATLQRSSFKYALPLQLLFKTILTNIYDGFLILSIPLQGYPGMQGGAGAPGPVGAAVKIKCYFQFSPIITCSFVCFFVYLCF